MGSGRDVYALRKDGSEVPVEIGLSPIQTSDGAFVLAAVTDITERQRALTAISDNAKRQTRLIDDLLDVTRIASGTFRVERAAVDLRGVVQSALDVVHPSAEAKRIHIDTEIDASIGTVFGDAARLQQIVWNVLTNAVKFTPEGGEIHVSVRRADGVVAIAVTDSGQGIAPDFLRFVFEPFRQADGSIARSQSGLGLGLTIVKHLVEAHVGAVSATSAGEGHGSTFTVQLPIVAVYVDEEPSFPRTDSSTGKSFAPVPWLDGVTVLVVEDDADSRELVAGFLEDRRASVVAAASAALALERLQRDHVDVLLVDIAMPGEDGYALMRKVRSLESPLKAGIPAAALTPSPTMTTKSGRFERGFNCISPSPSNRARWWKP